MQEEVIMAGFGGQGIMFMGKFLASIAMKEGEEVTYMPSYGAEVRGGTANCTVVISEEPIISPLSWHPSSAIVMNKPSLAKFESWVREGGLLLLNSSLIDRAPERTDLEVVEVPATEIAENAGSVQVANMVMLGAYLGRRRPQSLERAGEILAAVLPKRRQNLLAVNREALRRGGVIPGRHAL